jgi:hypothetical protein
LILLFQRNGRMRSRMDYMKKDEEDEKQAFLGEEAKFQS